MNGLTDLTPVIVGVITLLAAIITVVLVPWLKSKLSDAQMKELLQWVEIAVAAAQQVYYQTDGAQRKEYVLDFLECKGYDIDSREIDNAIEAAVLKLHQQLEAA